MPSAAPLSSIGEVIALLREEFPDVSPSKLRYLEGRGLVSPVRTSGGRRRYSEADIRQLRRALRLQRDDYLPIEVIAEQIAQPEEESDDDRSTGVDPRRLRRRPRALSADELCERSGIDRPTLDDIIGFGLVGELDETALDVCRAVADLLAFGIQPRHLRAFRSAADREIGLVESALAAQGIGSGSGTPGAAARLQDEERRRILLARCLDLHVALVRAGLGER